MVIATLRLQNRPMPASLLLIFAIQVALQFSTNEAGSAVTSCILLIVFMYVAVAFGGWTSLRGMTSWLRQHPRSAVLMVLGTFMLSFLLFIPEIGSIAKRASLVIQGVFFYYAGFSISGTLSDKVKANLLGK
jgi:hypothetical protein